MAEKSGFFNALNVGGDYDRKYNANDYSDNLAVIISNGVLRSENDDLRVTASGMVCTVGAGRAWIKGHYYYNDAPLSFAAVTAPAGGNRWDRIILQLDKSVGARAIRLRYVQGEVSNAPVRPEPVRSGDIYELVLADIYVGTNASSVIVTDTRADEVLCGWVYSTSGDGSFFASLDKSFNEWFEERRDTLASVTLLKRYTWRAVLDAAANTAVFDIPQYNEETTFLEVYVNGVLDAEGVDFTRSGNIITFTNTLVAGTEIIVKAYKSIDGTGILSVADEITQLQNDVAALYTTGDYEYICNGVDDNVKLSEIAQAWLNGGTDYASKTIRVYGTFGAAGAYGGSGTSASPYRWLSLGTDAATNRRIVFDFSACSQISPVLTAGTYNVIFYGVNVHVIGANVRVEQKGAGTVVRAFGSTNGAVYAENCRFWLTAYQDSIVAYTGTFTNCRASVANSTGNSYCFLAGNNGLLRVNGGEYYAYTGSGSGARSAVVGQSAADSVSILHGVNAPTTQRSGYYQTNALFQTSSGGVMNCADLVSALPVDATGTSDIRGTIAKSKAGNM